jgi:tetratricopeptide (TPR) repeat protein
MGGVTRWHQPEPVGPGRRALIAASGSAVGIVVGGSVYLLIRLTDLGSTSGDLMRLTLVTVVWVNLVWGLVNWLPIRQLDGGHILGSLLEIWFPKRHAAIADVVFVTFAVVAVVVALYYGQYFLAFLAAVFGFSGLGRYQERWDARRDAQLAARLREAQETLGAGDAEAALSEARSLAPQFRSRVYRRAATGVVLRALLTLRRVREAVEIVDAPSDAYEVDRIDAGRVYLAAGRLKQAIDVLTTALAQDANREALPLLVRAYIEAGTFTEATMLFGQLPRDLLALGDVQNLADAARRADALEDARALDELASRLGTQRFLEG